MSVLKKINKGFERVLCVTDLIAGMLLVMIVVFILLQIIFRTFSLNIQWTEEASRYSFIGLVFFGGVSAVRRCGHIAITTLVELLPLPVRRMTEMFSQLIVMLMSCILAYSSLVLSRSASGITSSVMQWFHMNYLYILVGLLCVLMFAAALLRTLDLVTDKELLQREKDERAAEEAENIRRMEEEYDAGKHPGKEAGA